METELNIDEIVLLHGSHKDVSDGVCAMEAVAWLAGEWNDAALSASLAGKRLDAVKVRAMALMQEAPEIKLPGGTKLTWKSVTTKGRVVEPSISRVLRRYAAK